MHDIHEIESILGINTTAAIIESLKHPLLEENQIKFSIKREDRIHPIISGNKWRKLKYIIHHALKNGHDHFISMGGVYSNHLHALAYVGNKLNIKTTGLIRGEQPAEDNPTLSDLRQWDMQLEFVSRSAFRELRKYRSHDAEPARKYNGYWIPEGGANREALRGVAEILKDIDMEFDTLALACGTGTTLAGLVKKLPTNKRVLSFSSLKGGGFLEKEVKKLINKKSITNWSINFDYHFGGFAKTNDELYSFIEEFEKNHDIQIDHVYNAKMFYGLFDLIKNGKFKKGHAIMAIHTGGLQGDR